MLFDVAALLITSAALGPAAEASIAHENTAIILTLAASPQSALPPLRPVDRTITGLAGYGTLTEPASAGNSVPISTFAVTTVTNAELATLSGAPFLQALSAFPQDRIASFVSSHPNAVSRFLTSPPTAVEVSNVWNSIDAAQQDALVASAPRLVANLDGVPTAVRDRAGRAWMTASIQSLTADVQTVSGRALAEDAQHQLHMLGEVQSALNTPNGQPARSLLSVDPTGQGKAAIVVGDLATADYVTYIVPGMFFKVDGQIDDWANDASDLYTLQTKWLDRIGGPNAHKTVAVVAWMGYQTPDLTNIGSLDLAYQGRDALARAVEGMQVDRAGNEPYTTIVAHSYGSTAALMALTEYDFSVDALALVGSPGSAAQSVRDLHVRNANVWVGAAAWDPVPNSAWFGSDPSSPSYGAKSMSVAGETDPITGESLAPSFGHNEYFGHGTESMRNMALIGIDEGALVDR
ncbi:MAG: hypothetical protein QOF79_2099 [Actinomycetota bacterium]|nr:hypothetical protein [Actinomycetota bacterium]